MATGRTIITIEHPETDIPLRLTDKAQTLGAIINHLEGWSTGALRLSGSGVYVEQGGAQASGTVTLVGTVGAAANGGVLLSSVGGTGGSVTVTIGGHAVVVPTEDMEDGRAALEVAEAVNADADASALVVATADEEGGTVTFTARVAGVVGNSIALAATSVNGTASASGGFLAGGADNTVTVTVNGVAVETDTTSASSATEAAALVAATLNASESALVAGVVIASASEGVVMLTAVAYGPAGNLVTLAAATDNGTATTSGARLMGGASGTGRTLDF